MVDIIGRKQRHSVERFGHGVGCQRMELRRLVRRRLIDLARRRQRPGSGSPQAFLRRRTALLPVPDLTSILEPLGWAVVGGVATRLYMPERATQDLDIVVRQEDAGEVRQKLANAVFRYQGELAIGGSSWAAPDGGHLDVVEMAAPWLAQALAEAQHNRDAQGLPILPLPYLAVLKIQAGRVQDLADVTRMLGQANEEMLDAVRRLFTQYLPEDIEDLESFIVLGQMEMSPPQAVSETTQDERRQ